MKTRTIKQSYTIKAPASKVWEALTKPALIKKWSGAPAKMSDREGSKFSIWGGDMFGTNLEVVKGKKLVQEWCTKSFKSRASFTLKGKGKSTVVDLIHSDVPADEYDSYAQGWEDYYLGAIRNMFEEG